MDADVLDGVGGHKHLAVRNGQVQLSGELAVVPGVIWPRLPGWKKSPMIVTPAGGMLPDPARRSRHQHGRWSPAVGA